MARRITEVERDIQITPRTTCGSCRGGGDCKACKGKGHHVEWKPGTDMWDELQDIFSGYSPMKKLVSCHRCGGTGICPSCDGKGVV